MHKFLFNHKLDLPFSPTNILCLKYYPHNLKIYQIKGTSKIPVCQLLWTGKNLEKQPKTINKISEKDSSFGMK